MLCLVNDNSNVSRTFQPYVPDEARFKCQIECRKRKNLQCSYTHTELVGQEGMVRRTAQYTSHLSKTMPPRYASRPTANICCGMGTALGETSVALYQGSLTVALGRLEINILIKVIIVPFKNTKFHGLNSIPRCKFYFHTKSLLHLQRVYLD